MGKTRRTVALSRYLAALNDSESGDDKNGVEDSRISGDAKSAKQGDHLCNGLESSLNESMASSEVGGAIDPSCRDEEFAGMTQHAETKDHWNVDNRQSVGADSRNKRATSMRLQHIRHHQQSGNSSIRNMGNRETFIVDSSTLLKKSKVWGAATPSIHESGKYLQQSPTSDRYCSNDNYDMNDNRSADGVVLDSDVPTTVSGDCDHVTIASDLSGLTPASHLHPPTPPHLFPLPTQKQQRLDQLSQTDFAAGDSTNAPLASSHGNGHHKDSHTPPPHKDFMGKQHRNTRHHWPPTPPKTLPHHPLSTSSQMPVLMSLSSTTPSRPSAPNQENNPNASLKDRRPKRGEFFSKPHQSLNKSTSLTHNNLESTTAPPRWKQKGAMLTIDTGTSRKNSSLKDRHGQSKPIQNLQSTVESQEPKTSLHTILQTQENTNSSSQPRTPESNSSPTTTSTGSHATHPSSLQQDILDTDTLGHQSDNSDKENSITVATDTRELNSSPVQQRNTAWNQVGHQRNQEPAKYRKQQRNRYVLRDDPVWQENVGKESDVSSTNVKSCEPGEDSHQPLSPQRPKTNRSHSQRLYNRAHPSSSRDQVVNINNPAQKEYNGDHIKNKRDIDLIPSPTSQVSSVEPSPVAAAAAAEVAAELVRKGGKSPEAAAAAFLVAIQVGQENATHGDQIELSTQPRHQTTDKSPKHKERERLGVLHQDDIMSLARNQTSETTTKKSTSMSPRHDGFKPNGGKPTGNNVSNIRATDSFENIRATSNITNQAADNIHERLVGEDQSPVLPQDLVSSQTASDIATFADVVVKDYSSNSTNLDNQVQTGLHEMEVRMEARMLRLEARLEAQLKARLEYMEAKMDARMDEIQSILKLMLTAGSGGGGGSSAREGGSLDEDYEV